MEIERVGTGVPGLDTFMGGGIPKGIDVVVHGDPGSGKTSFAIQFAKNGLENGESCIFVELDILPGELRKKMHMLGLDAEKYEEDGRLIIVDGVSGKRVGTCSRERYVIKDPRDLNSIAKTISDARQYLGEGGRIIIDSWASIALNFTSEYRGLIRFTEAFVVESRNSNYTTLLITDFSVEDRLMKILRHIASGYIEFLTRFEGNSKRRYILIHNLRFTSHVETPIPYTINSKGLRVIESRL
ncbi:RAD55 family ATPase [Archaeoglobus veneficus]|uniref:Putative circadian clock protein, KaiC n=1 Tax=Archaeoglobus veneficus (strain DSM 11195 / SNP6) TaxID=693661 RepID=F2KQ54_ARCVS|nr:RAD55 family ATPase [Archaeoglobus veneficus]AEA47657.1 putative circadian clock protein, KaiC [Archaeoglobus veneficus SNP6]